MTDANVFEKITDMFIPFPENLIVNLHEQMELIKHLLQQIPEKFKDSYDTNCALGAALQAAYKLMVSYPPGVMILFLCSDDKLRKTSVVHRNFFHGF